jgi:CRISPR-associated protein Csx16
MTTYLITRHAGAIEWIARQGMQVDQHVTHLDPATIQIGDIVIGTLPVNLAAQVCEQGGHFYNLSLDLPPEARGHELTADDLQHYGARLEKYCIEHCQPTQKDATQ